MDSLSIAGVLLLFDDPAASDGPGQERTQLDLACAFSYSKKSRLVLLARATAYAESNSPACMGI